MYMINYNYIFICNCQLNKFINLNTTSETGDRQDIGHGVLNPFLLVHTVANDANRYVDLFWRNFFHVRHYTLPDRRRVN